MAEETLDMRVRDLEKDHAHLVSRFEEHTEADDKMRETLISHDRFIERARGGWLVLAGLGLTNLVGVAAVLVKLVKG